jgi:hypothetical protein
MIFSGVDDAAIHNLQSGCGTQSDSKQKPKEAPLLLAGLMSSETALSLDTR